MRTATFRNSWGLVFPFSSQSVIPREGRSRPFCAEGRNWPGVCPRVCEPLYVLQGQIVLQGRSRPFAAEGGLRPGVYAGWGLGSNRRLFYFSALSASFTRLLPSPRRPVNGPDKSKQRKKETILVRRKPGVNAGPITAARKMPVNGHATLQTICLLAHQNTSAFSHTKTQLCLRGVYAPFPP